MALQTRSVLKFNLKFCSICPLILIFDAKQVCLKLQVTNFENPKPWP